MSVKIPSPGPRAAVTSPEPKDEKKARELAKASHEFEAIFVRSMLAESGALGGRKDAHTDMAIATLASTITEGKGLGLGESIRRAVEAHEIHTDPSRSRDGGR